MRISTLIASLAAIIEKHGDIPVKTEEGLQDGFPIELIDFDLDKDRKVICMKLTLE